jgi:hypothetical protein
MTAAPAACPGFPREPPSTWTTTFTPRWSAILAVQGGEVSVRSTAAAIADHALRRRRGGRATLAAFALAAIEDDRHIRIIGVVGGERVKELPFKFPWDH